MPDPYKQRVLVYTYQDGTPAFYFYFFVASPTGVFSDATQGDQYWYFDQSVPNNAAALIEANYTMYVPTVPNPTPGAAPLGKWYGGYMPPNGSTKSPYMGDGSQADSKT